MDGQTLGSFDTDAGLAKGLPFPKVSSRGPTKADVDGAIESNIAVMLLFSIQTRDCVWLCDRTRCAMLQRWSFSSHFRDSQRLLTNLSEAVAITSKASIDFNGSPEPFDPFDPVQKDTAIAINALCHSMSSYRLHRVFEAATG